AVAKSPDGLEMIAATRTGKHGGVTITANQDSRLRTRSEFSPPDAIEFSPSNNVAFASDASIAFVGSTTGMLFAFNTQTGELESYQQMGSEIRRIALSEQSRSVAAVQSASSGDSVVIINFDIVGPDGSDASAPMIE